MSTATLPDQQYLLLEDKTWADYLDMERLTDDRPGRRLTYDRGRLEVMTLSHLHESVKMLMHDLLKAMADELGVPRKNGGSTTFRNEDLDRGLEPDQCYYLANEPAVRGKDDLDLSVDPPPDVAIEVEVSRSAIDRIGIYAALGVPEVWRTDGESLSVLLLCDDGEYEEQLESRFFAGVPIDGVASFLRKRRELAENELESEFREWVRGYQD